MDSSHSLRRAAALAALGLAMLAAFPACTSVKHTSEDVIAWVRGALQTNLDASLERTQRAAVSALKALRFDSIASRSDALSGRITAITAKNEQVEIELTPLGPKQTRIDIRIGTFTDETPAREILTAIRDRL